MTCYVMLEVNSGLFFNSDYSNLQFKNKHECKTFLLSICIPVSSKIILHCLNLLHKSPLLLAITQTSTVINGCWHRC